MSRNSIRRPIRYFSSCFVNRVEDHDSNRQTKANEKPKSPRISNMHIQDELVQLTESMAECDMEESEEKYDLLNEENGSINTEIMDLPCEMREKIWQYFNRSEIKILRQVCSTIQSDIDLILALDGILDGSIDNFLWIQQVSLHSLTVQCLEMPIFSPFLRLPNLLKKLVIIQGSIPISNTYVLLSNFTNLTELTFSASTLRTATVRHKVMSSAGIAQVLNCVSMNPKLEKLDFTLSGNPVSTLKPAVEDQVEFEPIKYVARLKHLCVRFPDLWDNVVMLQHWKMFLLEQDQLETFCSYLGIMSWKFYAPTLCQCRTTLTKVALYDIQSSVRGYREVFDWGLFSGFLNLSSFTLMASQNMTALGQLEYLDNINFSMFPMQKLTRLSLHYVVLVENVLGQIFDRGIQLKILHLDFFRNPIPITSLFSHICRVIPSRRFSMITISERRPLFEIQDMPKHLLHDVCERSFYSSHLDSPSEGKYDQMHLYRNVKPRQSLGWANCRAACQVTELNV